MKPTDDEFRMIYNEHKLRIYNFIRKTVLNEADADELTQETFIKVYKNYDNLRNKSAERAWIFRIASNCCIDHFRRNRNSKGNISLSDYQKFPPKLKRKLCVWNLTSPLKKIASNQNKENIIKILTKMSEPDRQVLILYSFEKFKAKEIANIIEATYKATRKRIERAKKKFIKLAEELPLNLD